MVGSCKCIKIKGVGEMVLHILGTVDLNCDK